VFSPESSLRPKGNASDFFKEFLGNATHILYWLISYRDHAYPNEQQMKKIISGLGRQSRMSVHPNTSSAPQ
jgi:adenine-specific DNA-methyltransferase